MKANDRGFTVVEVVLFLGITGLMLLGVFAGTNTLISNSRFQDSVFNLESYLQRQSEKAWNGVNSRTSLSCSNSTVSSGASTPGTSNCLLLGRAVVFRDNSATIEAYDVVGSEPLSVAAGLSNEALLLAYQPKTVPVSLETYDIPWGTYFRRGQLAESATVVNAIAFLRSPSSSRLAVYHFRVTGNSSNPIALQAGDINSASSGGANYCVNGAGGTVNQYRAAINFAVAQGSSSIKANLNLPSGAMPC